MMLHRFAAVRLVVRNLAFRKLAVRSLAARCLTAGTSACALLLMPSLLAGSLVATPAAISQDRGAVTRTLQGKVQTKDGSAVKGAVVYLKDTRTSTIKSAVAEDDGAYRFVQLSQGTDYEVWAKVGDKRGPSKNISSFDSKTQLVINLKTD